MKREYHLELESTSDRDVRAGFSANDVRINKPCFGFARPPEDDAFRPRLSLTDLLVICSMIKIANVFEVLVLMRLI